MRRPGDAWPATWGDVLGFLAGSAFWLLALYVIGTTLGLLPA